MEIQRFGDSELIAALSPLAAGENAVRQTADMYGNSQHWFRLDEPAKLVPAAAELAGKGARLTMISACRRVMETLTQDICYHFELKGMLYTLTVTLTEACPAVPSITKFFLNADWHEREMIELYGIPVSDQPNPNRLFLDEVLDAGLLNGAVPLSVMMNGACSTDLWERILQGRQQKEAE